MTNWNNNKGASWLQTRLRTLVEKGTLHGTGMTHRPQA